MIILFDVAHPGTPNVTVMVAGRRATDSRRKSTRLISDQAPPNRMLTQLGTILTDLITQPLIIIERCHQSYGAFVVLARCYSITHTVLGSLDQ